MLKAFAVRSLLPEMLIGRTVYDGDSEDVLVEGGTVLDKETIKLLKKKGIASVYVDEETIKAYRQHFPSFRRKRQLRQKRQLSSVMAPPPSARSNWTANTKRTIATSTARWRNSLPRRQRPASST